MAERFRYGYRMYILSVGQGNAWRKPEDLADVASDYIQRVHSLLISTKGTVLKYRPDLRDGSGTIPIPLSDVGQPVMVIDGVVRDGNLIRCEVVEGTFGDHDELVGDNVERIGDRAAGRRYRIDLYFPSSGTFGLAVSETCKRYTPVEPFLRWLAWLDQKRAIEAQLRLEQGLSDGSLTAAELARLSEDAVWRKFRVRQVSDSAYLRKLIKDSKKVSVDLVEAGSVTKRGRFKDVEKRLQVLDVGEGMHEALADEILSWLDGGKEGALGRVMELLDLNRGQLSNDGLRFNNTSVHLAGSQPVSVTPDSVRDLFTYPLANGLRPDDALWEKIIRAKLVEVAQLEQVELDL